MEKISHIVRSVIDVIVSPWKDPDCFGYKAAKADHEGCAIWMQRQEPDEEDGRIHVLEPTYDRFAFALDCGRDIWKVIRYGFFPCSHKNWVDESYGGPDSGCMAGYCRDCGESFHHTLY